jgi:hypothetical protein
MTVRQTVDATPTPVQHASMTDRQTIDAASNPVRRMSMTDRQTADATPNPAWHWAPCVASRRSACSQTDRMAQTRRAERRAGLRAGGYTDGQTERWINRCVGGPEIDRYCHRSWLWRALGSGTPSAKMLQNKPGKAVASSLRWRPGE